MLRDKIYLVFFVIIFYKLFFKRKENMSNTQNNIREIVNEVYRADVEAIRNLSDIADKLQGKGKYKNKEIVLPGNLTIRGNLKIDRDLKVNKNLTVNQNSNVKGQVNANRVYVNDMISTRRMDVRNEGKGITHFNYAKKGENYIRGYLQSDKGGIKVNGQVNANNVYVDDFINTRRMDVRNEGKGITHFNHAKSGNNYIRGYLQSDKGGIKVNGDLNTTGTTKAKYIRGGRGQFGRNGYLVVGEHKGRGLIAARTWGCWYHSGNGSLRKLTAHKDQGNCSWKSSYFDV